MKENSIKFRESFGKAVLSLSDKQAGQLIKGISGYAFEGRKLQSNDAAIKSSFSLIKTALEMDEQSKQNGRIGGLITAEKNRQNGQKNNNFANTEQNKENETELMFDEFIKDYVILETMKALLADIKNEKKPTKSKDKNEDKNIAKN